jgi:hypothetical protein
MTAEPNEALAHRYEMLMRAYPAAYRRQRAGEIVDTMLASADPDRSRPTLREAAAMLLGGFRVRAGTNLRRPLPTTLRYSVTLGALLLIVWLGADSLGGAVHVFQTRLIAEVWAVALAAAVVAVYTRRRIIAAAVSVLLPPTILVAHLPRPIGPALDWFLSLPPEQLARSAASEWLSAGVPFALIAICVRRHDARPPWALLGLLGTVTVALTYGISARWPVFDHSHGYTISFFELAALMLLALAGSIEASIAGAAAFLVGIRLLEIVLDSTVGPWGLHYWRALALASLLAALVAFGVWQARRQSIT